MTNIYPFVAGKTFESHKTFLKKLKKKGAKLVEEKEKNYVVLVFCPIVSRFETDVTTALSSAKEKGYDQVILVAMHHTFDEKYTIPNQRGFHPPGIRLLVDCLFFETMGLLKCPRNKDAVKAVCNELGLSKSHPLSFCKSFPG